MSIYKLLKFVQILLKNYLMSAFFRKMFAFQIRKKILSLILIVRTIEKWGGISH